MINNTYLAQINTLTDRQTDGRSDIRSISRIIRGTELGFFPREGGGPGGGNVYCSTYNFISLSKKRKIEIENHFLLFGIGAKEHPPPSNLDVPLIGIIESYKQD